MKRVVLLAIATMACGYGVHAQDNKALERAGFLRDSVADVLAEHRVNYAQNENMRVKLKPAILSLEREIVRLQEEYDKVIAIVSHRDAKEALAAYDKALEEAKNKPKEQTVVEESGRGRYVPDKARMKRDLVANDFFAERLSQSDYKGLLDAQKREPNVKESVAHYFEEYGQLLSLQSRYMEAATREEADSVATLFTAKQGELSQLDDAIASMWSSIFYNKIYAYDLLMERSGNTAMLDFSADAVARAAREINENSEQYQSDALVAYFARKKALSEYEMQVASTLLLTTSRDSLKQVVAELKNSDYRLSKLSLQRRSFIDYEDIDVKIPTIYNSKNPVPQTKIYDYGTVYRIRIGLFSKRPNLSALRGVTPLSYSTAYNNGMYAYFVGGFRTEQEAVEGAAYLKKLGFKEPIIAVWVDGEYYPTLEDMRRSESQFNIELSGIATLTDDVKAVILSHKSDCAISRIGSTFVVGTFEGKSAAEAVVADLKAINADITIEISKKP